MNLSRSEYSAVLELLSQKEKILNLSTHGYFQDPVNSDITLIEQTELLEDIDHQIAQLLDNDSLETYQLLKNSGFEQYQVKEFADTLPKEEYLTAEQSQSVLMAKVSFKNDYETAVFQAAELIESGQREAGFDAFETAIEQYREGYLSAAQQVLSEHQFDVLQELESNNFGDMLASLLAPYED